MKNPGKSGLEPTEPSRSEDIALYQLSQILNYKTDGSSVNFRRMSFQSTQKTTEDVDNGHLKECRSFDVDLHCNTFKIRFRAVYIRRPTAVHAGAIAPGTRSCQTPRDTIDFFFWFEKKGDRPHPPNPLGYVPADCYQLLKI